MTSFDIQEFYPFGQNSLYPTVPSSTGRHFCILLYLELDCFNFSRFLPNVCENFLTKLNFLLRLTGQFRMLCLKSHFFLRFFLWYQFPQYQFLWYQSSGINFLPLVTNSKMNVHIFKSRICRQ